ncbi:MAG: hypothetical protein JOZ22_14775 [Acidobacteriia bacterium]|nr:hypothetical protein [Terriglobia bacterium]
MAGGPRDSAPENATAPRITSPVARSLAVTNLARSAAFYRDVLGFEVKEQPEAIKAVLGPAYIRLVNIGDRAVVFLETADVAAMRSFILARGGAASEIESVNWIKMRMFETRDPDGNVLWFGQTYHQGQDSPSRRDSQPRGLRQVLPELPFDNIPAAITYYCDVLGFRINYRQDDLGVLDRDAITILLRPRGIPNQAPGSFWVYVDDADALFAELSAKSANVQGAPVSHPWGLRDFSVLDLEGNRITFAQTFE